MLNDTSYTTLNSTSAIDLCLPDGRRSYGELWGKLFVAHATAITAYCHLLSIRGESIVSFKLYYFIISPLFIAAQVGISLLLLIASWIWTTICRQKGPDLRTVFGWLFEIVPPDAQYRMDGYRSMAERPEVSRRLGRSLVILLFLFHCCWAILLYCRREEHGGSTLGDVKAFKFAVGGVIIGILSLHTTLFPAYWREPQVDFPEVIYQFQTSRHFRDLCMIVRNPRHLVASELADHRWHVFTDTIRSWIHMSLISSMGDLLEITARMARDPGYQALLIVTTAFSVSSTLFFTGNMLCSSTGSKARTEPHHVLLYALIVFVKSAAVFTCSFWIVANEVLLSSRWSDIADEYSQLRNLQHNKSCSLLWSDPLGQHVLANNELAITVLSTSARIEFCPNRSEIIHFEALHQAEAEILETRQPPKPKSCSAYFWKYIRPTPLPYWEQYVSMLTMSNITLSASNNPINDLCPIDGRRSFGELWGKLFIAHSSAIIACCHLLSIRGESIISFKLYYFMMNPLILVAQTALSILLVVTCWIWNSICPARIKGPDIQYVVGWLFQKVPLAVQLDKGHYQLLHSERELVEDPTPLSKRLGRSLVIGISIFQCCWSIVLYSRRKAINGCTFGDDRVFEFAISGVIIGILSLGMQLRSTSWSEAYTSPSSNVYFPASHKWPRIRKLCMGIRNPVRCIGSGAEQGNTSTCWIFGWMRIAVLSTIPNLVAMFRFVYLNPRSDKVGAVFVHVVLAITTAASTSIFYADRSRKKQAKTKLLGFFIVVLLLAGPASVLGLLSLGVNDLWLIWKWDDISSQYRQLQDWPKNVTCPMLWSDPLGNMF